jgi:hypothetical protein
MAGEAVKRSAEMAGSTNCEYGGKKDDTEIWREVFEKI